MALKLIRALLDVLSDTPVQKPKSNDGRMLSDARTVADVINRSFNIIQRHSDIAWRQQADLIIEPDVKGFVWDDFTRTPDLIAAGEAAAQTALPQIHALIGEEKRDSAA